VDRHRSSVAGFVGSRAIEHLAKELVDWRTLPGDEVAETVQWAFGPDNQPNLF